MHPLVIASTDAPQYEYQGTMRASGTTKGVARESGGRQKRPREEDRTDTQRNSHKMPRLALPSGLLNFASACFSNAAVQLLASAVTPAQIAQLVGDGIDCEIGVKKPLSKLQGKQLSKALTNLGQGIAENPPPKLSPYLGKVLDELHSHRGMAVDPVVFQQVFASGSAKKSRENFRGDTQQDASEYLRDLISAVSEEHSALTEAFQYKTVEAIVCTAPGCDYRNERSEEAVHLLEAKIPAIPMDTSLRERNSKRKKSATPTTTLSALIEHQANSELIEGSTCERCKSGGTLARRTFVTQYPDHLFISINRSKMNHPTWGGGRSARGSPASVAKDTTRVEVNLGEIRVGEKGVYRMVAMIKHKGEQSNNGHYTAYRRVDGGEGGEGGAWVHLDDEDVKLVEERSLEDGVKGFSSILLLQRQAERPSTTPTMKPPQG